MRVPLAGQNVVITGGTGGFARALAPALLARGAKVALLDLDADAARDVARDLGPAEQVQGWRADVRNLREIETAMAAAASAFGGIDVVIANAGLGEVAVLLETEDPGTWERTVDVNLNGVYRTFRAAVPYVTQSRGYLLATSSMAAFIHSPMQGAYTATKAAVWAFCDSTRLELRHTGVRVGSLHPTFFATPMMAAVHADAAGTRLWNGNRRGLWKMADIEVVVRAAIRGIERRSQRIAAPGILWPVTLAPGIAQAVVDRVGFPGQTIEETTALIRARPHAAKPPRD